MAEAVYMKQAVTEVSPELKSEGHNHRASHKPTLKRGGGGATAAEAELVARSVSEPEPHGSAFDLSPGSGSAFRMRIRIQLLMGISSKSQQNSYYLELFD